MKLGVVFGYWGAAPRARLRRGGAGGRAPRLRLGVGRRIVGQRRVHVRRVHRRQHLDHQDRHRHRADGGAHAHRDGDGGDHARPPLQRPPDPRPRRVRPAGGRGLVRPAVEPTARAHARVRRHHPAGAAPRGPARERRRVLPAALPRRGQPGTRQAAQDHDPPAPRRHPDLPRRRGPEERHPDRGDRRRLAAALLLAVPPGGLRRPVEGRQARLRDHRDGERHRHRRRRRRPAAR